jgi:hypothetical protein
LVFQIDEQDQPIVLKKEKQSFFHKIVEVLGDLLEELMSPPAIATVSSFFYFLFFCFVIFVSNFTFTFSIFHNQFFGFLFGAVAWLRNLIIGDNAPFSVIQDTLELLGYVT